MSTNFTIPKNEDIDFLSKEQKDELCESITECVKNYMSDNRLPSKIKENIELNKYLDIKYNLLNNESLFEKIITNDIKISDLPWMEPHELDIKLWKSYIDKRNKNIDTKEKMATVDIFKCRKCGEMKCTTYQLQTASIDEPMTTYVTCKVCGFKWKFH